MGENTLLARFRLHRFKVLNNVGYMLVTLAASHGLLSYSFFQELIGASALFRPTVMIAAVCLVVYFARANFTNFNII
jgi:hypothetical protein